MATKTKTKVKDSKKPSWSATSYKKIEARRQELGLSKSAMAKALGVNRRPSSRRWRA